MNRYRYWICPLAQCSLLVALLCIGGDGWVPISRASELQLDESPAQAGQWGYRPEEGTQCDTNPPSFTWRPMSNIVAWEVECRQDDPEGPVVYRADGIQMNVHCPPETLPIGQFCWRYRGTDKDGRQTRWSKPRGFSIDSSVAIFPMPTREQILDRIPDQHPRLFVRPEEMPRLRAMAEGDLQAEFEQLVNRCWKLLKNPPSTEEPPKYGPDIVRKSEQWREIWWGNRKKTIAALENAANLAFVWNISGEEAFGELAKHILLQCAEWDPKGSTGYRYNDEAGMPYAYHFARTYTFLHALLDDQERKLCQEVLKVRGDEMYRHLYPNHLWRPFSSHSNRAWHFLGEVGIATLGEVEGAEDWIWFAANVFHNVYPAWSDADGGWHEGFSYWNSYLSRFTWWADVMKTAWGVDAYQKPYFSQMGYYPIYLMPPGKVGGGFGDLNAPRSPANAATLMGQIAVQAGNGHWQWYAEQAGYTPKVSDFVSFLRSSSQEVTPIPPDDLPASRLFAGTGQAMLNSSLVDASDSVQVLFKSSPFGTQSHGYEANNSFLLWAFGQRMLVRSGYRDIYGSDHHRDWMWSTRSVNNITVDGQGQLPHSAESQGRIVDFLTTPHLDVVVGEAGEAYRAKASDESILDRYTRSIYFFKPDLVVIHDRLVAKKPSRFEYWLHSPQPFEPQSKQRFIVTAEQAQCEIDFLAPAELIFQQTDQYDPNPRDRIKLREWHLTAKTEQPSQHIDFLTLLWPRHQSDDGPRSGRSEQSDSGTVLFCNMPAGKACLLIPAESDSTLRWNDLETNGENLVYFEPSDGSAAISHYSTGD